MGESQIGESQTVVDREIIIPLFNKQAPQDPPWKGKTKAQAMKEGFERLRRKLARVALTYLETKGLHYDLDSTMVTVSFLDFETRKGIVHGNFTAIKKSEESSGERPSVEMFFAEAVYKEDYHGLEVGCCTTISPAVKGRCEFCSRGGYEEIRHPVATNSFTSGARESPSSTSDSE
ncbi:hypothetical protein LINGRAHAP2_LOCUS6269 [Linum grandiflorum]